MSITVDQLRSLLADPGKVYSGSDRVGSIGQVYVDDSSGEPSWVTVKTGLFGTSESFAPLEGARVDGHDIVVAVDEHAIKSAPRVDPDGSLSPEEEESLYRHYGLHGYGSDVGDRGTEVADRGTEVSDRGITGHAGEVDAVGRDTSGPTTDDAMTRSEERLRVSTREREVGRARLRKYVVSERVTQSVPVRHEELSIEREPITETVTGGVAATIGEEQVEIVLHEEIAVVDKEVVAAERIRLGTRTVTEETTVSGEVRREEIELENTASRTAADPGPGQETLETSAVDSRRDDQPGHPR